MLNGRMRAAVLALACVALGGLALPAAAQDRPLGDEVPREQEREEQQRELEHHRREMERHREEMERHARAMRDALVRAYQDSAGELRMYYREGLADSMRENLRDRFIYSAHLRSSCARMGFAFDGDETITVRDVLSGSAAEAAGVRPGDVILRVDGRRASSQTMAELAERLEPGDEVRLEVRRDGRELTIDVTAREAICPVRTMLSQEPFQLMCLKRDSSDAEGDDDCAHEFVYELQRNFEDMQRHMPLRMFMESGDSGMVLRYYGPDGGDSLFIDLDSVRMMSDAIVLQLDSLRRLMPYSVHIADSLRMLMPSIEMELRDAGEEMAAHGLMLRSMELGARALAGANLTELSDDLGEYFQVDQGVLVTRVEDGTPAARAGLRGGDVIVSINGNEVTGLGDVRRHAGAADGPIELVVVRRGERRTIRLAR